MKLSAKFMRSQLAMINSVANGFSLERMRKWQERIGKIIASKGSKRVKATEIRLGELNMAQITPNDILSDTIIIYLHGGGYTCGEISYAKGFATTLASRLGCVVYAPAYRLAPEHTFPCAIDDSYSAYEYVISLGHTPDKIVLCGESAGGGLCYSLCLKIKENGESLPAGIIAISPWTDLTLSGESYKVNKKNDPSITYERLKLFADCYMHGALDGDGKIVPRCIGDAIEDIRIKSNPLASPIFADLEGMPPSLILVGGDEVMLDDSVRLNEALLSHGARSRLLVAPKMWHAYPLYNLKESDSAFKEIIAFLRVTTPYRKKLRWLALDNSAKIYPAARRRNWSNVFRLSATLDEDVDRACLSVALDIVARRFPSIAVRLKTGMFWYYIEEVPKAPPIMEERAYPLSRMAFDDIRKCAFRVIVYKKRIAVEFFHALTDGNGGLIFLKTLVAEYLKLKHGIGIPTGDGILDSLEEPSPEELEDSFMRISSPVHASRSDSAAFKLTGTPEENGFRTNTTFIFDSDELYAKAKSHGVTVTIYLSAILAKACLNLQQIKVKNPKRRKPVKILIPVNLRKIYNSKTLRNFVFYVSPGVDPRLGEYSLDELCRIFSSQMTLLNTEKQLSSRISTNVESEKMMILKLAPLFLKNIVMKLIFNAVGEKASCFTLSNLGVVKLPEEMASHVKRMDFVLGVQASAPYNTGLITYDGKAYLNIIRNIKEPLLERALYEVLKGENIRPCVESNSRKE
ncbi:MAG: alpha/beta hydrolase fold domain-containing protein [Clostridia bacterium]|nr:alpha/beta hydrolase fold domain-containing protein [Clostridia bacterium]